MSSQCESSTENSIREYSILGSLDRDWIKLPHAAMIDVGPATQTLGGILSITSQQTFVAVEKIAICARVPVKTARNQLGNLDGRGWVKNLHRQVTRGKNGPTLRKTATYGITDQTRDLIKPYGILPDWGSYRFSDGSRLNWSARAVLSVIMSRLAKYRSLPEVEHEVGEEFWGSFDNFYWDDRFRFSITFLERTTGLRPEAIVRAKRELASMRIIKWSTDDRSDIMVPNREFRIVEQSIGNGKMRVDFKTAS